MSKVHIISLYNSSDELIQSFELGEEYFFRYLSIFDKGSGPKGEPDDTDNQKEQNTTLNKNQDLRISTIITEQSQTAALDNIVNIIDTNDNDYIYLNFSEMKREEDTEDVEIFSYSNLIIDGCELSLVDVFSVEAPCCELSLTLKLRGAE